MKYSLSLLAALLFTLAAFSQRPPAAQAPPSIGRVYGKLVDSAGKGVADLSVIMLQQVMDTVTKKPRQLLLKGGTTLANGDFSMEQLPVFTPLVLKLSGAGFKTQEIKITIIPKNTGQKPAAPGQMPDLSAMASAFEQDLGKIKLESDVQQLGAVTVSSTSGRLKMDIDKKVFNVDKNIVTAGGTALDVMRNVPSVNVDIDGNVSVRNAAPQIYVDGRPTTLTLDQIPADAIESVEVITNPSAKYDASGGNAGILNIVLKKNKRIGYNGNLSAGVDKRGGINGGGSFSVRQNKFNVTLAGFGNQMKNRSTNNTDITSFLNNPTLFVSQDGKNRMNGGFLFGRIGLDYFLNNRTSFSLGYIRVKGSFKPTDRLSTDSFYSATDYKSYSERNATNERTFNASGIQAGFKYIFPKPGTELTADLNHFGGKSDVEALYNTKIYSTRGGAQQSEIRQQILGNGENSFTTIQTDFVAPLSSKVKLEAGLRAQLQGLKNAQGNFFYDPVTDQYQPISSASANYKNDNNVYAAYSSFTGSIKDFGYKLGLRAESSTYTGELPDLKQKYKNDYPISLFPSIFFSQKLKKNQEVQLSFTRRINRPNFMQLIPFIDSTDQLNWTRGNAELDPEFTSSLEASYTKTFSNKHTFLTSIYYKHTDNLITRFLDTLTSGTVKRPISTYINANSSRSMGIEFTSQNQLAKWWDINSNLNIYNSKINTDNITAISQDAIWSWFAKFNSNFKMPKNFSSQLSATYQSKTNLPPSGGGGGFMGGFGNTSLSAAQGYIRPNWGVDVAVKKTFLKNNAAAVTFSVSDIFRTRTNEQYSYSEFFIQDSYRIGDSPLLRLNFTYSFGKVDMSLFKRKNMKPEMEGAQGGMQGMGN
ncbi:MAG: TonB-dependent receptor [Chitinophagaceae bacterium]|nr:MAG: TonB-dependent receptor [Chitinophagaceae bacterium]